MSGNKIYQGRFAELLRAFIEEKRSLGCRYKEEERLSFIFDQLSLNYDCSDGLTAELAGDNTEKAYQFYTKFWCVPAET